MSSAKTTTNHDEIRKWVEKRGGHPAVVSATENKGGGGGLLRIDYDEPGGNDDDRLHRITWNEFFQIFDRNGIAFLYDPDSDSRFSKFVQKEPASS
jgi:hypothetical protein